MDKFTPGEWLANKSSVYNEHGAPVGHASARHNLTGKDYTDETESNARLFAAAKEMYYALKITEELIGKNLNDIDCAYWRKNIEQVLNKVRSNEPQL